MAGSAESQNQRLTIGIVVTCLALSAISFGLRIYARNATAAKLWWDDYWMIIVMLICVAMSTSDFVGLAYGSGIHQSVLDELTVLTFKKNLYFYMIFWSIGVFSVKVGILLFYWRVFHTRSFRVAALAVGGFSGGIFMSNLFVFTLQCIPVSRFWNEKVEGKCIDQHMFYLVSAIINVLGDVAVLTLPIPVVWRLHTSRSKKWSLSFLFLLGALSVYSHFLPCLLSVKYASLLTFRSSVCIASIFRIVGVFQININDFTFSNVAGGLWSTVEVEIGFICANLPAIRPIVFKWFGIGSTGAAYASGSGGHRQYGISSKGATRSGHVILRSRTHESDLLDSDTEALTRQGGSDIITPTNTKGWQSREGQQEPAYGLSDIVVKTDIGISIDSTQAQPNDRQPNHFVQITAPHSGTVDLPGVGKQY
ncbi:hypothetical protein F5B20DRAFT_120769 [Whalleya microplaca]|nr:hypothetical protein F5B20DRAFT_120769 [Whalleya microplaca]